MALNTRITYTGKSIKLLYNLEKSYAKMMDTQLKLSDGKKIHRPSDSPINITNDLKIHTKEFQNKQFERNITDGKSLLSTNDMVLQTITNYLQRERELAVEGRSDTLSGEERKYLANEAIETIKSILGKANTKFKGRYIFNGTQTDKPPYELRTESGETITITPADISTQVKIGSNYTPPTTKILPSSVTVTDSSGNTTYEEGVDYTIDYINGYIVPLSGGALDTGGNIDIVISYEAIKKSDYTNNEKIYRQISEETKIAINLSASEVFDDTSNGNDLFDKLILLADGLWTNNPTKIEQSIDEIDRGRDLILKALAKNGAKINIFEKQTTDLKQENIEIANLLGEFEDIDFAEEISNFALQENLFQASMKAGAGIIQRFLGNYL